MVGIAFADKKQELHLMLDSMGHFPWHLKEVCKNVDAGIVRLKNLDDFKFEDSNYSILLDGYIYNHSLNSIAENYTKQGEKILENLDGEFTLFFYSKSEGAVYVVTDPFGLRRCYYSIYDDRHLLVATETKAIAKIIEPTFDESTIYSMIRFRRVFSDRTFFNNIHRLMPGHIIKYIKDDKVEIKQYYQYAYRPKHLEELEIAEKTAILFKNALDKRISKDKRNVIALSGGLDSRCMTILSRDKNVSTFTFGSGRDPDSIIAKKIAKELGLPHTLITFDCKDEKIAKLVEFASYLTEGLTTIAFCYQLYVFSQIYKKFDTYFWTFELDDTLGGNLLGQVSDQSDYEKYSPQELMLKRSIFTQEECKKLFLAPDQAEKIINEHFKFVGPSEKMASFENAQLIDLLQRGTAGHFIARNFLEEKIPTFDKELISHIQEIPLELKINHYIYYRFLNYISTELAKVKSATTGLSSQSGRSDRFLVRIKGRFDKFKQLYLKMETSEKNYFDVDLAMRSKPWIEKYRKHVMSSNIVKKYINVNVAEEILCNHMERKENNGTKLFAILTVSIALNVFSREKTADDSKSFFLSRFIK